MSAAGWGSSVTSVVQELGHSALSACLYNSHQRFFQIEFCHHHQGWFCKLSQACLVTSHVTHDATSVDGQEELCYFICPRRVQSRVMSHATLQTHATCCNPPGYGHDKGCVLPQHRQCVCITCITRVYVLATYISRNFCRCFN